MLAAHLLPYDYDD